MPSRMEEDPRMGFPPFLRIGREGERKCFQDGDAIQALDADVGCSAIFDAGDRVRVVGLRGRHQNVNGHDGHVVGWDSKHAMWKVRMSDGSGKMWRGENLEAAVEAAVRTWKRQPRQSRCYR